MDAFLVKAFLASLVLSPLAPLAAQKKFLLPFGLQAAARCAFIFYLNHFSTYPKTGIVTRMVAKTADGQWSFKDH